MSALDLFFGLALGSYSVIVAAISWRQGHAAGQRQWRTDAQRAFDRGYLHGIRQERLARACDPGLNDEGEEWKRGGR